MISTSYLTHYPPLPDTLHVLEKERAGFGDLNTQSAQTAQCGFFSCVHIVCSFMGGDSGDTFGYAGGFECRFANPAICRSPVWRRRGLTATQRGSHA